LGIHPTLLFDCEGLFWGVGWILPEIFKISIG
jgi:hypothetical protein